MDIERSHRSSTSIPRPPSSSQKKKKKKKHRWWWWRKRPWARCWTSPVTIRFLPVRCRSPRRIFSIWTSRLRRAFLDLRWRAMIFWALISTPCPWRSRFCTATPRRRFSPRPFQRRFSKRKRNLPPIKISTVSIRSRISSPRRRPPVTRVSPCSKQQVRNEPRSPTRRSSSLFSVGQSDADELQRQSAEQRARPFTRAESGGDARKGSGEGRSSSSAHEDRLRHSRSRTSGNVELRQQRPARKRPDRRRSRRRAEQRSRSLGDQSTFFFFFLTSSSHRASRRFGTGSKARSGTSERCSAP